MSSNFPPVMTGDSGSGGKKGLVPAPAAGDAAAGKLLRADGTWVTPTTASFIGTRVYNSGAQSISDSSATALTFDTENYDTDTMHSTSSNTSRLVATTAGKYVIQGQVTFASSVVGTRLLQIKLNGTTVIAEFDMLSVAAGTDALQVHTAYTLAANDYVEFIVTQTSGGALNANAGIGTTWFAASLQGGATGATGATGAAGASAAPFVDSTAIIKGSGDATKLVRIEADGITTGTTRVWTAPDADTTIPIFGQIVTFAGPSTARTYTLPDAATTLQGIATAQTVTNKRNQPRVYTAANNASLTPEKDTYDIFHLTAMSAATTINNPSTTTMVDGETIEIRFLDNGTGRALTWGSIYVAKGSTALPSTTTANKNLACLFEYNANLGKLNLMSAALEA